MNVLHFLLPFCCSAMKARCSTSGRVQGGVRRKNKWRSGVVAHLHGGYTYVTSPGTAILRSMTMINLTILQRHLTKKSITNPRERTSISSVGSGTYRKPNEHPLQSMYLISGESRTRTQEKQSTSPQTQLHVCYIPSPCASMQS